ncbi:MAG: hypothetical protein AUK60_05375 [Rhodobacteraceae bacterium CG2_30_10_405]|nr:MAG: hypothetical protein AUK60_05375 [Rhodobacteraceae bacterium CG2_30_10_405]
MADLRTLQRFVREHQEALCAAISADYGHRSRHETLLAENDADLLNWVLGKAAPPAALAGLLGEIAEFSLTRFQPKA